VFAGFAECEITPDESIDLWGYIEREGPSQGVLDNLKAQVLYLTNSERNILLISLDLGGIDNAFSKEIKENIEETTGVSRAVISIATTHTHSAPAALYLRHCGDVSDKYMNMLKRKIVQIAITATENTAEVSLGYNQGTIDISVNRREQGVQSDLYQDSGTTDSSVGVLRIDKNSRPFAIVVNYAAHPVTLRPDNNLISADYPGVMRKVIQERVDCGVLFLQGASADINPKVFGTKNEMEQFGSLLGKEVLRVMDSISPTETDTLTFHSEPVMIPFKVPATEEELQSRIQDLLSDENLYSDVWKYTDYQWAISLVKKLRDGNEKLAEYMELPVQCMEIDGCLLAVLPGEVFSATGLKIKESLGQENIMVVGYANDNSIGYLAPIDMYKEGGYEVENAFKFYGLLQPSPRAEEQIRNSAINLLRKCAVE